MFISFILLFLMIIIGYKVVRENPPDFFSDNFGENKKDKKDKNNSKKTDSKKVPLQTSKATNTTTNVAIYPLVYESFVQNKTTIQEPISSKNLHRGKSEKFFETYLKRYFGENISTDKTLIIKSKNKNNDNHSDNINEKSYFPDFIYQNNHQDSHQKDNFFIDIEIDEPYSLPDGYPVHYQGLDNNRNMFFLRAGWHVVRFSEEQIMRQPAQCCRFLADFIQKKQHQNFRQNIPKELENIPSISLKTRHWTREEALYMFSNKYRDSYPQPNQNL